MINNSFLILDFIPDTPAPAAKRTVKKRAPQVPAVDEEESTSRPLANINISDHHEAENEITDPSTPDFLPCAQSSFSLEPEPSTSFHSENEAAEATTANIGHVKAKTVPQLVPFLAYNQALKGNAF